MDALMLMNVTDSQSPVLSKAIVAGGIVVEAFTGDREPRSVTDEDFDTLVVHSDVPDVFDGVDDLAPGLESMGVDRMIFVGDSTDEAIDQTATAAIVLGFDAVIVAESSEHVQQAVESGAQVSTDVWLRM
ncbi:isochorismatase family protein [Brevibacterium sp. UMB1308A]|uniref:isochorismatase family protein n=1 Tax=Brevibacterium sp. UMB1308A TaxID=3050608 RepID=UPI00254F4DD9|nr:isochorismatase family protein [Brevibacterium sp. UMB1308A]MDK8346022.1 isochorismatase family protein [Brevibacterium sp. UMB1308B]MDK8713025.1 isochorismatase family protein [Brevibacterium sp. UMB1308A]